MSRPAVIGSEAPHVQTGVPGQDDRSYYQEFGKYAGAVYAEEPGIVTQATDRQIVVQQKNGEKKTIDLDYYSPGARKTYMHQSPVVAVGQEVKPGDLLVKSNQTNDQGEISLGMNAKVVMMPWKGLNFEDSMVVSESFAKRMTSQHMYTTRQDWTSDYKRDKRNYTGIFPSKFGKEQLENMDDNGVVKVGTVVHSGDPLVLAARYNDTGKKKGRRRTFSDQSQTWEHHDDGVVTDVFDSPKGTTVLVKTGSQLKEGDKLANRFGNKGLVSRILPDDEMPHTEDGMTAEIAYSPGSTSSRLNPSQLAEIALGKVAAITGKSYRIADFEDIDDVSDFVEKELKKHGVDPFSAVIDQKTGKRILNDDGTGIPNGTMWMMKLHHTSEAKLGARSMGGYTAEGQPAKGGPEGAKRMSVGHLNALVGHGAYQTFMDAKYNRGQENDEMWTQYMQGLNPTQKKTPLVYKKFEASLKASGINVQPDEGRMNLMAMTSADVKKLSGGREIKSGETLRWEKDQSPIAGGLFDPSVFGMDGMRWGQITPVQPILNPVMEEPARLLLGLKQKELADVMSGKQEIKGHGTGMQAIGSALSAIDVKSQMARCRQSMKNGKGAERDMAARCLGYLKACEANEMSPKDWMLDTIPVLPPKFRPVSEMQDSNVPLIDDANYLYKTLVDQNNSLRDLRKITKSTASEEAVTHCANIVSLTSAKGNKDYGELQCDVWSVVNNEQLV